MEPINRYSLEDFAERHRADFDLHEPRPELWALLEKQLDADVAARPGQLRLSVTSQELPVAEGATLPAAEAASLPPAPATPPVLRVQRPPVRWQPLGIVLGVLALVLTLGLTRWNAHLAAADATAALSAGHLAAPDAALYLPQASDTMLASQGGARGNARLDTAVHGMERYYAAQLTDRQAQLSQLDPESRAEWAQDMSRLDSIYQQLKAELPQHPQPEAVLTAMNRNLQTRLDILDQQLALRGSAEEARTAAAGAEYSLADSRVVADNLVVRRHAAR